ncbi:MAG: phage minor head protein [Cyanobacteria bacterium P01_F01_bin.56]
MPTVEATKLPFAEAVTFLRGKVNVPTERWDDLRRSEHDWAFVTAGATSAELLQEIRNQVDRSLQEGIAFGEFKKQFDRIVERHGWDHAGGREWRADLIYRQNFYQAYAAGRYQQQRDPDVVSRRPYLQYRHGGSRDPRPTHLALDGQVFPINDPFWDTWTPPNGFGCRCFTLSLSDRDLNRLGLEVSEPPRGDTMTVRDPDTGQTRELRNEPDRGFDYAPGASVVQERRQEIVGNILERLEPQLRDQVISYIAANLLGDFILGD